MPKPSVPNAARQMAKRRWSAEVRATAKPAGRKRSDAPRCPCGEMTLNRAESRNHKCDIVSTETDRKAGEA
jgi:hypothetical protein